MGPECREEVRSSSRRLQAQGSLLQIIIIQTTIKQVSKMQRPKITAPQLKRIACRQARCGSTNILYSSATRAFRQA